MREKPRATSIFNSIAFPLCALGFYAAFLFVTLADYGVTWDEVAWFRYGYQQWEAVLRGTTASLRDVYTDLQHYGTVPAMAAAATHHLFHDILGWVPSYVGYHIANVGFALILAAGIAVWAFQTLGSAGSAVSVVIWMLLPRLWPDAHYNISDLPGAAGCLWTAWAVWRVSQAHRPRIGDYLLCGALAGLSFSLRAPNVYFLTVALLVWFAASKFIFKLPWKGFAWWGIGSAILVFFVTVKVLTPSLWHASVLKQVFWTNPQAYLFEVGRVDLWFMGRYYAIDAPPFFYAPWVWLVSTPLVVIACWAVGVGQIIRRRSELTPALLLWLILWIIAVFKHIGGSGAYDGVRHFLEGYAPMTLLAAAGALMAWQRLSKMRMPARIMVYAILALGTVMPLYTAWRIHPYQSGYFNALAGPLPRAWHEYEIDYWGQSFLPASKWIRQHVRPDTPLYVADAAHIPRFYLSPPYGIKTMAPYWDFDDYRSFRTSLDAFFGQAPAGAVLLQLNRPRLYRGEAGFDCPPNWQLIHKEGPDPRLPPMMLICQKPQQSATR